MHTKRTGIVFPARWTPAWFWKGSINRLSTWRRGLVDRLPDSLYLRWLYRKAFGTFPRIKNATKWSEKLLRQKLGEPDPRLAELADKLKAKEFVAARLGPDWNVPTLWSGSALPPRDKRNWPRPYVLKPNHASGWYRFIHDPEDWPEIESVSAQWMRSVYGRITRDHHYAKITPRLLVEPFLGGGPAPPEDIKLWVFGGRVHFIEIHADRLTDHHTAFFDRDWKRQPFTFRWPPIQRNVERPQSLSRLIEAAEVLSKDLSFVRVDFYEIEGRPLFGEFTFSPDAGLSWFNPPEYDRRLGELWPG